MSLETKQRWSLTGPALERLLARLGGERAAASLEYDRVRRALAAFFKRRGFLECDALADETIDRVARRLEEGEKVEHLNAYFFGAARLVAMERNRRRQLEKSAAPGSSSLPEDGPGAMREMRVACLEGCLRELPAESRKLIVGYYGGGVDARKRLANALGLTYTNLKTRAHRIRNELGGCLEKCLARKGFS